MRHISVSYKPSKTITRLETNGLFLIYIHTYIYIYIYLYKDFRENYQNQKSRTEI